MTRALPTSLLLLACACAGPRPAQREAPPKRAAETAAEKTAEVAPPSDPFARCEIERDEERATRSSFRCAHVVGAVDADAEDGLLAESRRLRAALDGGRDPARFYLAPLEDVSGRTDSFRFERGGGGGLVAVRREDGRTRSATCRYERDTRAARARCHAVVTRALSGDERFAPPDDDAGGEDDDAGAELVVDLREKERGAAMAIDDALAEYGSGCEVERHPGLHMLDCDSKLLAILVGHEAPAEATPEDLIRAMRRTGADGDDNVRFELFDDQVKTPRGTVSAKRFTAEDEHDTGGGLIVSDGLTGELRFLMCVWKDGGDRAKRCASLVGALLR